MFLSYLALTNMGEKIFVDFNRYFFGAQADKPRDFVLPLMVDQFARDYLELNVSFEKLSEDGSICGLTAYANTEYVNNSKVICLKQNDVLMDSSFLDKDMISKNCPKRRFTLAHECAHQILFRCGDESDKQSFRKMYSERRTYSLRDLKSKEDWNERQANILASAIIMPRKEINFAMQKYAGGRKLVSYDGWFGTNDYKVISKVSDCFGVSKKSLAIRLEHLGYIRTEHVGEEIA